jgi:hypothetical protein
MWMGWAFVSAAGELREEPAGMLYVRFVGWVAAAIREGAFGG